MFEHFLFETVENKERESVCPASHYSCDDDDDDDNDGDNINSQIFQKN